MSMNNYPPGVTGQEPQITGIWPCVSCGARLPELVECPDCNGRGMKVEDEKCPTCAGLGKVVYEGDYCPHGCIDDREESDG